MAPLRPPKPPRLSKAERGVRERGQGQQAEAARRGRSHGAKQNARFAAGRIEMQVADDLIGDVLQVAVQDEQQP